MAELKRAEIENEEQRHTWLEGKRQRDLNESKMKMKSKDTGG